MADVIIDKIIRTKRKTIALIINDEAQLIIRAPIKASTKYIEKVVYEKRNWIKNKQELIKRRNKNYMPKKYIDGEGFLILGENYSLKIISDSIKDIIFDGKQLLFPRSYLFNAERHMLNWYKRQSKELINKRVKYFSNLLNIKYNAVKITDARKRWGSCSAKGNLNFSWRIYMAPIIVLDYVVVHELMHVLFHNHSKEYWDKVRTVMPDYKKHKQWLNDNQKVMNIT